MTSAPSVGIAPGSIIAGRYEILGSLGEGGMATVWKAHDRSLDVEVALKVLKASPSRDPVLAQRFKSEIKLARLVRHRNVCGMQEYGEDGDLLFITMELVEGKDLRRLLAESGPLDWEQALDVAIQITEGLEAIHQAGVIHRDLKPANITRDAHGLVRVMDFGIAKAWGEASGGATRTGHVPGSPAYMSPEQVRGTSLDFRSDIYSLGLVLYELFTGLLLFPGMMKRLEEDPDLEGPAAQRIPTTVLPILRKALARETGARYQTCSEILADLRAARTALASEPTDPLDSESGSETRTGPTQASMPVQIFSREAQARILIPPLIRATRHADREVRLGAVEALGRIGGDSLVGEPVRDLAAEGLESAQRDEDERVRQAAVRALARVPRPAPPPPAPRPPAPPRPTHEPVSKPTPWPPIEMDRSPVRARDPVRRPSRSWLVRLLILFAVVAGVLALVWIWISRPERAPAAVPPEPPLSVADSAPEATLPAPLPEVATPAPVTPSPAAPQVEAPPTSAPPVRPRPTTPSERPSPVPTAVPSAAPTTLPEPAPTPALEPPGPSPVAAPAGAPSADSSPLVETPPTTLPPPAPPVTEAPSVKPECLACPIPEAAVVLADRLGLARAVRLRVHVSATGDVLRVDYLAGPLPIRDAITQAVRRWRFRPALRGSVPVASFMEYEIKL